MTDDASWPNLEVPPTQVTLDEIPTYLVQNLYKSF